MVGGSSRIPLVARRLEEEFGRRPRLIEPDLCVVLGAALLAGTKATTRGCLRLDPIPTQTVLSTLTVTGAVVPVAGLSAVQGCTVTLRASDGSSRVSRITGAEGTFVIKDVRLAPEATTELVLTVTSAGGNEVATHNFTVHQSAAAGSGVVADSTNLLSKPIKIQLVDSDVVVAPERSALPFDVTFQAKTTDASGRISVPILEDDHPLGEILMTEIPKTLPVGSAVEIKLSIQGNYQVRATACVPELKRDATVVLELPVRPIPTRAELLERYVNLDRQASDALATAGRGVLFGGAKATRLKECLARCRDALDRPAADCSKIDADLDEVQALVRSLRRLEAQPVAGHLRRDGPGDRKADQQGDPGEAAGRAGRLRQAPRSDPGRRRGRLRGPERRGLGGRLQEAGTAQRGPRGTNPSSERRRGSPGSRPAPARAGATPRQARRGSQGGGTLRGFEGRVQGGGGCSEADRAKAPDAMAQIHDWYYTRFEVLQGKLHDSEEGGRLKPAQD